MHKNQRPLLAIWSLTLLATALTVATAAAQRLKRPVVYDHATNVALGSRNADAIGAHNASSLPATTIIKAVRLPQVSTKPYQFIGQLVVRRTAPKSGLVPPDPPVAVLGTATLIGPKHLVTAAECVLSAESSGGVVCVDFPKSGSFRVVGSTVTRTARKKWTTDHAGKLTWGHDMGLVRLQTEPFGGEHLSYTEVNLSGRDRRDFACVAYDMGAGSDGGFELNHISLVLAELTAMQGRVMLNRKMTGGMATGAKIGQEFGKGFGGMGDKNDSFLGGIVGGTAGAVLGLAVGGSQAEEYRLDRDTWQVASKIKSNSAYLSDKAIGGPLLTMGGKATVCGVYSGHSVEASPMDAPGGFRIDNPVLPFAPELGAPIEERFTYGGTTISGQNLEMVRQFIRR